MVLAEYTGFSPFYAVAACMFAVCYPFLIVMCTVLKLDRLGVHLLRPVRPIHIAWEDVRFTGCLTMRKPLPGIMHECINRTRMAATIRVPFYLHYGSIDKLSGGVYSHSPSIPLTYTGSNRCTFSSLNP